MEFFYYKKHWQLKTCENDAISNQSPPFKLPKVRTYVLPCSIHVQVCLIPRVILCISLNCPGIQLIACPFLSPFPVRVTCPWLIQLLIFFCCLYFPDVFIYYNMKIRLYKLHKNIISGKTSHLHHINETARSDLLW